MDGLKYSQQVQRIVCVQCPNGSVLPMSPRRICQHLFELHKKSVHIREVKDWLSTLEVLGAPWVDVDAIVEQRASQHVIAHLKVRHGVVCMAAGCGQVFATKAWYSHRKMHDGNVAYEECRYQTIGRVNVRLLNVPSFTETAPDPLLSQASAVSVQRQACERLIDELQLDMDDDLGGEAPHVTEHDVSMVETCATDLMDNVWAQKRDVYYKVMLEKANVNTSQVCIPLQ